MPEHLKATKRRIIDKIDETTFLNRYYDKLDELMQLGKEELGL